MGTATVGVHANNLAIGGDEIALTNRAWRFKRDDLARRFGFARLGIVNDFAAIAWATHDTCTPGLVTDTPIDLDTGLAGAETKVEHFDGCASSSRVELWTIQGGSHIPALDSGFAQKTWAWLKAHPKP